MNVIVRLFDCDSDTLLGWGKVYSIEFLIDIRTSAVGPK